MQRLITWENLVILLGGSVVVWYGAIGLLYYRKEIIHFVQQRDGGKVSGHAVPGVRKNSSEPAVAVQPYLSLIRADASFTLVHELMDELRVLFSILVRDQPEKSQVLDAIRIRLQKYAALDEPLRYAINNHIGQEYALHFQPPLTNSEIQSLW